MSLEFWAQLVLKCITFHLNAFSNSPVGYSAHNRSRNARDVVNKKVARFMLTVYIRPNLCFFSFIFYF